MFLFVNQAVSPSFAQIAPDEHASHHPGDASATMPSSMGGASSPPSGGMGAGGMGDMGKMMEGMGKPQPRDLYPSLMGITEWTPEKRNEVSTQANERMKEGLNLLGAGLDRLQAGMSDNDFAAMEEASAKMRDGIARFDSGVAARRALAEGKPPRDVALKWFRSEMSLPQPGTVAVASGPSWFHLSMMALLILFAAMMILMYFFKMRRAAALFGRLDSDSRSPPPGASPPLGGTPGPSGPDPPPNGKPLPSGGTSPAGAMPAPTPSSSSEPTTPPTVSAAASPSQVTANWRGQLRVGSIVRETPTVKTFRLLPSSTERFLPFTFVPGQFLNVAFHIGGARMNRSYSISSSPTQREYVDLTVRREPRGAVSRHLVDLLKVGDQIEVGGPVGRFTFSGTEAESIVLISAGVGITPMVSIARYLTERSWPGDIFFMYTCRTPADYIFAGEVATLQRLNPKLHVVVTISKPDGTDWKGPRGRLTKELLAQSIPDLASRRFHLCGPPSMMDSTKAILSELGVAPDQIKTEAFGLTKPAPAAPGTTAKPIAPATGPLVTFSKNNKSAKIHLDLQTGDSPPQQTLLELSEELGIGIEFSCRVGTCGICKVKMTSGEVEMAVQDALDDNDKASGIILACQAKPKSAVMVEA